MVALLTIALRCLFSAGSVWFCALGMFVAVVSLFGLCLILCLFLEVV